MNAPIQTSTQVSKAEFVALVEAYLGAREHVRWVALNGTFEELQVAVNAAQEAGDALLKGAGHEP